MNPYVQRSLSQAYRLADYAVTIYISLPRT